MAERLRILFTAALLFAACSTFAQEAAAPDPLRIEPLALSPSSFNLNPEEWNRYRELLRGEAGLHYRNLNPLWVLGIYAGNDAERQRYAELAVTSESRRIDKLLAFNRAWIDASERLYPDSSLIDLDLARQRESSLSLLKNLDSLSDRLQAGAQEIARLAFFTAVDCTACDRLLSRLIRSERPLDIYLVGSNGDDEAVQAWAAGRSIDRERVLSRSITLNHDHGLLSRLDPAFSPPALFYRAGDQLRPTDSGELGL